LWHTPASFHVCMFRWGYLLAVIIKQCYIFYMEIYVNYNLDTKGKNKRRNRKNIKQTFTYIVPIIVRSIPSECTKSIWLNNFFLGKHNSERTTPKKRNQIESKLDILGWNQVYINFSQSLNYELFNLEDKGFIYVSVVTCMCLRKITYQINMDIHVIGHFSLLN
ncbi:hypothetical protein ACJX0J_032464, partial [Zea mays]